MASTPSNPPTNQEKRQAAEQGALLREVDEAVRADEFTDLFKRYGTQILVVVGLGLAAFGGWLWWSDRQEAELEKASEELTLAVDDFSSGQVDSAARAFESLAEGGEGGAQVVATLAQAGIAVEQGRLDDAIKIYAGVAGDSDVPKLYRDFATIREVTLRYDSMEPAEVEARLRPLAVADAAWFGSAGELLAHALLDQGKEDQAGDLFRQVATDDKVPESIKFRARQMAGSLGVDSIEDVDEALQELRGSEPAAAAAQ